MQQEGYSLVYGSVPLHGGVMTYMGLGEVKSIWYKPPGGIGWEIACSRQEDTDAIWQSILTEAA